MKKLLCAAALGAAAMWFWDPENGAQRRDQLQRKLNGGQSGSPGENSTQSTGTAPAAQDDLTMYATR